MSTYLDNLAAAVTQEKNVLDRLVSNNEKLVDQLERLTNNLDQLSSNNNGNRTNKSDVPMLHGKDSNLCNMKQKDIDIHVDTNSLKDMIVTHTRILVMVITKRLSFEIQNIFHLEIRAWIALITSNMGFGFLLKINDKLSSMSLNVKLLSVLK